MAKSIGNQFFGISSIASIVIALICGITLTGCASPKGFHYLQLEDVKNLGELEIPSEITKPTIRVASNSGNEDIEKAKADGYILVGRSTNQIPNQGMEQIKIQANKIGASLVIVSSNYTGQTINDSITVLIPNKTYHSGTINTTSGPASYQGVSTSYEQLKIPTISTKTSYQQTAFYFAKQRRLTVLGMTLKDIQTSQKVETLRDSGASIFTVERDSISDKTGMMPGDLITHINGVEVKTGKDASETLAHLSSKKHSITLNIIRKQQALIKKIEATESR